MAQERTLDVAELIEGRKPGAAQIGVALLLCTLMLLEGYDMQTLSFAAPSIWNAAVDTPSRKSPGRMARRSEATVDCASRRDCWRGEGIGIDTPWIGLISRFSLIR